MADDSPRVGPDALKKVSSGSADMVVPSFGVPVDSEGKSKVREIAGYLL
jgi:hypothetical protein